MWRGAIVLVIGKGFRDLREEHLADSLERVSGETCLRRVATTGNPGHLRVECLDKRVNQAALDVVSLREAKRIGSRDALRR